MLTRLPVNFSPLNEHRFRHNFEYLSGAAREDTENYFLHWPLFCTSRQTLLWSNIRCWIFDTANMTTQDLCCLLLYGKPNPNGSTFVNRMILEATISFIKSSKRFA